MPFGPGVLVYKVAGKMFATLTPEAIPVPINLKCDPDRALELRDEYAAIEPGYHMRMCRYPEPFCIEPQPAQTT